MARKDTPACKRCARKHDNFKPCPQLAGAVTVGGFSQLPQAMSAPDGYEQSAGWGKGLMVLSETAPPVTWLTPAVHQGGALIEPPEAA